MQQLKINNDIKNLNFTKIEKNLFYYKYDLRNVKPLLKSTNPDISLEDTATFNSFKGEVYENIIYELLLEYASKNDFIKSFVLKGPHQNRVDKFYKTGLMIDRSLQIVYKSNYKDISEFDALFFTEDALYFVEMSTSKKTVSLNKRLDKKQALLKALFPHLHIRALIVLTEGTIGIKRFPSYCTIWITKDLEDIDFLKRIVFNRKKNGFKTKFTSSKFIEAYTIEHKRFIYFQTLEWILKRSRQNKDLIIDLKFFKTKKLLQYFDIFTKLYIGFLTKEEFKKLVPSYEAEIQNVFVSLEKINTKEFDLVYYVKNINGKLRRVRLTKKELSIKDKALDGFTNAEVRFMKYLIEDKYLLSLNQIELIQKKLHESGFK
ncbi:hypothetical protein CP965_01255 [Halarcobacter mediterraneus]|uniref:Uncharacterized protein n=1 Tax=Halarcobacter mediterraneus TaxID=2023153 RepID=A0A4Q1AXN8_9BACT|nr:hypothetical protein [Halarcobacter mediterraneus]RXK14103.1 hypothetical protein CP965_01255 [Halarcobacter mediterraneus]